MYFTRTRSRKIVIVLATNQHEHRDRIGLRRDLCLMMMSGVIQCTFRCILLFLSNPVANASTLRPCSTHRLLDSCALADSEEPRISLIIPIVHSSTIEQRNKGRRSTFGTSRIGELAAVILKNDCQERSFVMCQTRFSITVPNAA
jgi:hypothetical protein